MFQCSSSPFLPLFRFSTRENEAFLLQNAKKYTTELEKCKAELDKADNFPENSNTEVSKLRQQLLKYNNDLAQAEERAYNYEVNIERYMGQNVSLLSGLSFANNLSDHGLTNFQFERRKGAD